MLPLRLFSHHPCSPYPVITEVCPTWGHAGVSRSIVQRWADCQVKIRHACVAATAAYQVTAARLPSNVSLYGFYAHSIWIEEEDPVF